MVDEKAERLASGLAPDVERPTQVAECLYVPLLLRVFMFSL